MILTRKTEELREKPVPAPLCAQQIPHRLTKVRTLASMVTGQHPADLWHGLGDYKTLLQHTASLRVTAVSCKQEQIK
jgi:hypothetical protein